MLLLIWKCIHMMQMCIILSSECHLYKELLGFDSRVSIWHRCEWFISQCCVLFACVLSFDTMSQILQNVLLKKMKVFSINQCVLYFEWMCNPNGTMRFHFWIKCLMYEIVCRVQEQVCCRKGLVCCKIANNVQSSAFV